MSASRPDPGESPTPMAPQDLLRAYANIAVRVNHELPKLWAELEKSNELARLAHGLSVKNAERIEDIAFAVKARTRPERSSLPPASNEKIEFNVSPTKTGTHFQIDSEELERLKAKIAEKEAREQGARDYALDMERKEDRSRKREKATRERYLFILAIVAAVASAATYGVEHLAFHRTEARP